MRAPPVVYAVGNVHAYRRTHGTRHRMPRNGSAVRKYRPRTGHSIRFQAFFASAHVYNNNVLLRTTANCVLLHKCVILYRMHTTNYTLSQITGPLKFGITSSECPLWMIFFHMHRQLIIIIIIKIVHEVHN